MPIPEDSAPGIAAYLITLRLVERLILRGLISVAEARELVDTALLDAEKSFGSAPDGVWTRRFLEQFLDSLPPPTP